MDNSPEDWEKLKRIKTETEKAVKASTAEDKSKLAYIDPRTFAVRKGLTYDIEAYRVGSEKISNLALCLIILGVIADAIFFFMATHLKMEMADMIPAQIDNAIYVIFVVAPAVAAIFAIVEALIYAKKTKQKLTGPIITSVITIAIFLVWQSIRIYITSI